MVDGLLEGSGYVDAGVKAPFSEQSWETDIGCGVSHGNKKLQQPSAPGVKLRCSSGVKQGCGRAMAMLLLLF